MYRFRWRACRSRPSIGSATTPGPKGWASRSPFRLRPPSPTPSIWHRTTFPGLAAAAGEVASPPTCATREPSAAISAKSRAAGTTAASLLKGGDRCFAMAGENQFHAIFGHDHICAIVHPSDTAPILVALDAKALVTGPHGERTIAIADIHLPPAVNVRADTSLGRGEDTPRTGKRRPEQVSATSPYPARGTRTARHVFAPGTIMKPGTSAYSPAAVKDRPFSAE